MSRDAKGLTPKMRRFVFEFLACNNASEAARRAGYSEKTAHAIAWRVLNHPLVAQEIAEQEGMRLAELRISADHIRRRLASIAFSDIRGIYNDDGTAKLPHELDDATAASIAGIEVEELFAGRGEDRVHIGRIRKVKRWDAVKALDLLARITGMLEDQLKVTHTSGVMIYLPDNGRAPE